MNPDDPQQPQQPQRPVQPWQPGQPTQPSMPVSPQPMQPPAQPQPTTVPNQQPVAQPTYTTPVYPQPDAAQVPVQPTVTQPGAPEPGSQFFQPKPPATPGSEQPAADFGFITNPDKPAGRANPLAGGSTLQRSLFAVGGLAILVILVVVVVSIIGSSSPDRVQLMTSVAQQQTELNRVARLGANGATTNAMRGAAISVQLSSLSARVQVSSYLATNKEKLNSKLLGLKRSTANDTALKSASANNTYNSTFAEVMTNDLNAYKSSLKTAYDANPGPKGRDLLKAQYAEAELLTKQIKAAANVSVDG